MTTTSSLLLSLDIETQPELPDILATMMPEFEGTANTKDPIKIEEQIRKKREAWTRNAALDALSGRVLAVGFQFFDHGVKTKGGIIAAKDDGDEKRVIERAFELIRGAGMGAHYSIIGFGLQRFDAPYLTRRAWKYRIPVPQMFSGRYLMDYCVDLRERWTFGDTWEAGSLGTLAKYFGLPPKLGDGADFAALWNNPDTRPQATAYLQRDLELPYAIGVCMGLFEGAPVVTSNAASSAPPPVATASAPSPRPTDAAIKPTAGAVDELF